MSAVSYLALITAISGFTAVGGGLLFTAAQKGSWALFALSICCYSLGSCALFALYRSGADSFINTTFACLLGSLLASQCLSLFLGEPFKTRPFIVITLAIFAFAWAVQTPNSPKQSLPTQSTSSFKS